MNENNIKTIFLYPGQIITSIEEIEITTILGSCVSVCLWDKVLQIGGMNHYLMPIWVDHDLQTPKYGNIATEKLYDELLDLGAKPTNLIAKIFGGAKVLDNPIPYFNIGEKNIDIAIQMLKKLKIPIIAQSVGGNLGRKIFFNTKTGLVKMKFV